MKPVRGKILALLALSFSLFGILFAVSLGVAFWIGRGAAHPSMLSFFVGLATLFAGLVMSSNWLGQKPDYSRRVYAITERYGPGILPRSDPGPEPSDQAKQALKRAQARLDLMGPSTLLAGTFLLIASAILTLIM